VRYTELSPTRFKDFWRVNSPAHQAALTLALTKLRQSNLGNSQQPNSGAPEAVAQRLVSLTEGGAADSKVVQIGTRNPG
jgi:hypothetical protein